MAMMLQRLRLRVAIPMLVLAVGVAVAALLVAIELHESNEKAAAMAIRQLGALCSIMVQDIERGLRRGDTIAVAETLRPVRSSGMTEAAVVLDDENRVLEATQGGSKGQPLSRTRYAGAAELVDAARRSQRPQSRLDASGAWVTWAHPFSMPVEEGELLPTRTGVLLVQHSLEMPWIESVSDAFTRAGTALVMIALLCGLVTWALYSSFTPRIDALVEATERVSAGQYGAVPSFPGDDELARIGQAFSEMAAKLERDHKALARSEAELRELNADLEDRVRERTAETLAYALDMESFAFMISHDLRTPLRSIAGFAQVLAQDNAATIGQEGLENLGRVLLNTKRMTRLIDDILAFSRHSRQPLQTGTVELSALARSVLADILAERQDGDRIHVRIDDVPPVVADEKLLRQVVQNLLTNAIKYSGIRETAEIHFGSKADSRGPIYYVTDNGVGFAMKYASQIFAPFKRLHAPTEYEGTGVGLAIVKRVLDRHHGSVWVQSQIGVGTTFYFTFYRASEAVEQARSTESEGFRRVGEVSPGRRAESA
jgi:signal transduction histidine kinase